MPHRYHSITPYLIVDGAAEAIEFYGQAFGDTETFRLPWGEGRIGHAELRIGDSTIMLADASAEMDIRSPRTLGGTPVSLLLYVDDVDEVFSRAIVSVRQNHSTDPSPVLRRSQWRAGGPVWS